MQIKLSNYNLAIIDNYNQEISNYNNYKCCFNQCNCNNFNNLEELFYHKHQEHIKDTKLYYLNDFWFKIINYMKKFNRIPKIIDIIKQSSLGLLNFNNSKHVKYTLTTQLCFF